MGPLALGTAFILDLLIGDPPSWPHPVVFIGRLIGVLVRWVRRVFSSPMALRLAGVGIVILVVGLAYGAAWGLIALAGWLHPLFGAAVGVYLAFTCLAVKGLYDQTWRVALALRERDMDHARRLLGMVVGRETRRLDRPAMIRALVETVAENFSDGVVAPLFYLALGGPALGMAYKAVNTLDSMIGYKDDRYRHLGWAAARLDDLAGFIPARLAALLIALAAGCLGFQGKRAFAVWWTEGRRHSSPNAGRPEAAMAGALDLRLGGPNVYGGVLVEKPYIGQGSAYPTIGRVLAAERIMLLASGFMLALGMIGGELIR
jgi:adenosylcobinamide-phosphate synthase